MGQYVKMEDWQLDNCNTLGRSGKGQSGRDKFNNSAQDFSVKVDLRGHLGGPAIKKPVMKQKKKGQPTVFQYLKNRGYCETIIIMKCKPRKVGAHIINTQVINIDRFLFDNQVRNLGSSVLSWCYFNPKGGTPEPDGYMMGECSEYFYPNR